MNSNELVAKSNAWLKRHTVNLVACAFIALAVVGSLGLASCAHTPAGLQREQALYTTASNR